MNRQGLASVLSQFQPDPKAKQSLTVQRALFLARWLLDRSVQLQTPFERRKQAEIDRMLERPSDKVFGPVLGVMRFTTLSEAVDLMNQTSIDYHRYGNLGVRAKEARAEPL